MSLSPSSLGVTASTDFLEGEGGGGLSRESLSPPSIGQSVTFEPMFLFDSQSGGVSDNCLAQKQEAVNHHECNHECNHGGVQVTDSQLNQLSPASFMAEILLNQPSQAHAETGLLKFCFFFSCS